MVSDVTKDNCTLEWQEPDVDGNSEVTHYIVERMDVKRGTWTDAGVGLVYNVFVKNIKLTEGKEYMFRVKAANVVGESEPLDTEKPTLAKNPFGTFVIDGIICV